MKLFTIVLLAVTVCFVSVLAIPFPGTSGIFHDDTKLTPRVPHRILRRNVNDASTYPWTYPWTTGLDNAKVVNEDAVTVPVPARIVRRDSETSNVNTNDDAVPPVPAEVPHKIVRRAGPFLEDAYAKARKAYRKYNNRKAKGTGVDAEKL